MYIFYYCFKQYSYVNIYNGIIFPTLNHAKFFLVQFPMNIVNKKFGCWAESHAQWLIRQRKLSAHYCGNFEFITFLGEFKKGSLLEAL